MSILILERFKCAWTLLKLQLLSVKILMQGLVDKGKNNCQHETCKNIEVEEKRENITPEIK
jgi:hypothetical protein